MQRRRDLGGRSATRRGRLGRAGAGRAVGLVVAAWALTATVLATGSVASAGAAPAASPAAAPSGFVAVAPVRLVDTRVGLGSPASRIGAGFDLVVDMPDLVPADATGVALTVTADQGGLPGFVTAAACGPAPTASLLNPLPDEPRSNQAVVPIGADRRVCVSSKTLVHVVVDLTGWLSPGGDPLHPTAPTRVLDTRSGPRPDGGTGKPEAGSTTEIPLIEAGLVPAGATAVSVNVTMTEGEADGYVTAFPCGGSEVPPTSTGNAPAATDRAATTFVGLGDGDLCLHLKEATHLVVDVTGWFGPGAGGQPVHAATPRRLLDTRTHPGGRLAAGEERPVALGLPDGTAAAALNVTLVDAVGPGWARVGPCDADGTASAVNTRGGEAVANLAVTPVGDEALAGTCVTTNVAGHVVVDLAAASALGPVGGVDVFNATLQPAFRPDVLDYVVRCPSWGANAVNIRAVAEAGSAVAADGGSPAGGVVYPASLRPGDAVALRFTGADDVTYRIRCLPPDFPQFTAHRTGETASSWYVSTPFGDTSGGYVVVFDREGVPVWWYRDPEGPADAKVLPGPRLAWTVAGFRPFTVDPASRYSIRQLDGTLLEEVRATEESTDFHDMIELANGNRLVLSYVVREHADLTALGRSADEPAIDARLEEVTPAGDSVWVWRSQDHIDAGETLQPDEFGTPTGTAVDLIHVNSMEEDGDGIVVSARHLHAVFRIDRATGNLTWKLGGTPHTRSPGVKNLSILNDPLGGPFAQHDARILDDGSLTIFDNRGLFNGDPRAARYDLDLAAGTATLVESVNDPEVFLSFFIGSARRTAAGTWVVNWGGQPLFTEAAPDGERLFILRWNLTYSYRTVPVTAGELTRDTLAAGMDAL